MASISVPLMVLLALLESCSPQSITVTRFPSVRNFDLDGRVTVSGVEIRFSDPILWPVHAVYGLRYASLGGEISTPESGSNEPDSTEFYQPAAKRRFMHSVAAFIYETPAKGHIQKTGFAPDCPQPRDSHDSVNFDWSFKTGSPIQHFIHHSLTAPQSEDCLTLNIFVPESRFLSDGGGSSPRGNFALYDLHAAIQWIHSNIHRFGGDPDRITLMGHSHGASLVHLFATSMLSIGPNYYGIKQLILFDGSAEAPWATASCEVDIKSLVETFFQMPASSTSVFELLQNLPVASILEIQRNLSRQGLDRCLAPLAGKGPTVSDKPYLFNRVSLLYGQTEFAGVRFYRNGGFGDVGNHFNSSLRYLLEKVLNVIAYPLLDLLKYVYAPAEMWSENADSSDVKNKIQEIYTDALFWGPGLQTLRQHEIRQDKGQGFGSGEPSRFVIRFSQTSYGEELGLLLGAPFTTNWHLKTSLNRRLSQSLIQYIASFVYSGDPNKPLAILNVTETIHKAWPSFRMGNELVMKMHKPSISFNSPPRPEAALEVVPTVRMHFANFWTRVFPKIAAISRNVAAAASKSSNNPTTHLIFPSSQFNEVKVVEPTTPVPKPQSEKHFAFSNVSVEFPAYFDSSQMQSSAIKEADRRVLLLTIVVGLSLFLLNIVFTAIFYFCHQQRKNHSSAILIPASEADNRGNKSVMKPTTEAPSFQTGLKLPPTTAPETAAFQHQSPGRFPHTAATYTTLQRHPTNAMEVTYPNRRVVKPIDSRGHAVTAAASMI